MVVMNNSQQFGFLLLELLCALSLFMLAASAAGGFLVQLAQYQKKVEARCSFLAAVTQLLETEAAVDGLVAQEVEKVTVVLANRQFHVATLQVQGAEQKLMVTQCVP